MFLNFDTVEAFAVRRNPSLSFPFLKENGELLSIAVNSGFLIEPRALELYNDIYENAYRLIECYPQYYRFILGLVQALESAGKAGNQGHKIVSYTAAQNLVDYDTSDVRRLEALHLLSAGGGPYENYATLYDGIINRVDAFIQNPELYFKFNKPLFYDLTHIIYFLTDFGQREAPLKGDPIPCLMNIGLLALLDNDADLLSEVGLCLHYLKQDIPQYWDEYLTQNLNKICISYEGTVASALNPSVDEYHLYLVSNAYMAARHQSAFQDNFESKTPSFYLEEEAPSLLLKLSDWAHMMHFKGRPSHNHLDAFLKSCSAEEYKLWTKSLASHPSGLEVVRGFSGLN